MRASLLAELNAERESRHASILVTDIATGAQRLVHDTEVDRDPLAPQLREQIRLGKSAWSKAGKLRFSCVCAYLRCAWSLSALFISRRA